MEQGSAAAGSPKGHSTVEIAACERECIYPDNPCCTISEFGRDECISHITKVRNSEISSYSNEHVHHFNHDSTWIEEPLYNWTN